MKVLVCDDDDVVLKVVELVVKAEHAEAVLARDGRQALQLLKSSEHFDLIITDIHMPYHNGEEILHLVRVEQGKDTPIIMLSSDGEEEVIALAMKQGVNDFVVKPVHAKELGKKVKKLLR
jgi:DNA-binding response OmpR family regulator